MPSNFMLDQQWVAALISILLLLLIGMLAIIIQNRRRRQNLLLALNDSVRSKVVLKPGSRWLPSIAIFDPAPPPFRTLEVELGEMTLISLLLGLLQSGRSHANQLVIRGNLTRRPNEELIWMRGRPAGRALARRPDPGLWELRRLDLVEGEFSVRGVNLQALEHAFFDLQARFGAFLQQVYVQVDGQYEVEIVLQSARLSAENIPALITTVRSLGSAALR